MGEIVYIAYIFMILPAVFMLLAVDSKAKKIMLFYAAGVTLCVAAGEINTALFSIMDISEWYFTNSISPLTEEFIKSIPVCIFAYFFSRDRKELFSVAFVTGMGFGLFENICYFTTLAAPTVGWALSRSIGSALMHGLCTAAVGEGIAKMRSSRLPFFCTVIAYIDFAAILHGIFNVLVQSERFSMLGILFPLLIFIKYLVLQYKNYIIVTRDGSH